VIFFDQPYVSDFLKETALRHKFPVVTTPIALQQNYVNGNLSLSEKDALKRLQENPHTPVYTNSENAIGWIAKNLPDSYLAEKIELFKNKALFRKQLEAQYPDFFYREIQADQLEKFDIRSFPKPFILKPNVGFFSMGVYKIEDDASWQSARRSIEMSLHQFGIQYPKQVLDTSTWIIEECVPGDEYAFDAYFNSEGKPVVLNIFKHLFSSANDVSDRVYISSADEIRNNLMEFEKFLQDLGQQTDLKNFPLHVELRRTSEGKIVPIEVNPLRFGGWCTTADMTHFAFDFNAYAYFFRQERPDWDAILKSKEDNLYSIIVLDNSSGVPGKQIKQFDYDSLLADFHNPLELRKIDYRSHPLFGFLFTETPKANFSELECILKSDLNEYIST